VEHAGQGRVNGLLADGEQQVRGGVGQERGDNEVSEEPAVTGNGLGSPVDQDGEHDCAGGQTSERDLHG
jgi:hypothetical protein